MTSMKTQIWESLATRLQSLTWVKQINYERIKIGNYEFQEHEMPAIQFWDGGSVSQPEQRRSRVEWELTIELVMKSSSSGYINHTDLFDKMEEIEHHIGGQVQLNINNSGMIHITPTMQETDLHTFEPYYVGRLTFVVLYMNQYTGPC